MVSPMSNEYSRRLELIKNGEVPTMSEVKAVAGLPLSLIIFEECHPDLQSDLGLAPPLQGPSGSLWTSPSDLLQGKVALKPPLTQKHIQALTHQGILKLGAEIEHKFLNEMESETEKKIKEKENYLNKIFQIKNLALEKEIREEQKKKYDNEMSQMRQFFEKKICQLLFECYDQIDQLERQMQIEIESRNASWKGRLQSEVQSTVEKITTEFLEKMGKQEQLLVHIFTKQIKNLKAKSKYALDLEKNKCREIILQMKHKLHCQNLANLMYLLCKERRKCKKEKTELENHYLAIIHKQKLNIRKKDKTVRKSKRLQNKKIKQLNVRERCLIEILKQFQKFIYFALKAAPTQGEFLLNINKLIKFEINDYCIPSEVDRTKPSTLIEAAEERAVYEAAEERPVYEAAEETIASTEPEPSSHEEVSKPSDVLPAFYFNEKMYVREDFRDMFSAGMEIDRKHSLWNPDVEELLSIFQQNIEAKRIISEIKSHHSSVHFHPDKLSRESSVSDQLFIVTPRTLSLSLDPPTVSALVYKKSPTNSSFSRQSSKITAEVNMTPSKKSAEEENEEKELRKVSLATNSNEKKVSKKSLVKDDAIEIKRNGPSPTQSKLMLARDSIILHISNIERKSLQIMSKMADENFTKEGEGGKENEESIEVNNEVSEVAEAPSQRSLTERQDGSQHTSKLLLTQDSLELIKSQIGFASDKEKSETVDEKPRKKSLLSFAPKLETKIPTSKQVPKTSKLKSSSTKKPITPKSTPRQTAKVVGSRKSKEHEKPIDEFTDERIKSLLNIMKENPSLIRLFTPCLK